LERIIRGLKVAAENSQIASFVLGTSFLSSAVAGDSGIEEDLLLAQSVRSYSLSGVLLA